MAELTDEQLVERYLTGDRAALNFLIKRYLALIYNFILNYVRDGATADDLTQEVFVKVWKKIRKYNPQYKFKSWLYVIAKNTCLDYLKKKKEVNFSALQADGGLAFEETARAAMPPAEFELARQAALINSAVEKLPEKYRAAIKLRYQQGYKFREIAARLKESIETVKSRNRRALIRLKRIIKK